MPKFRALGRGTSTLGHGAVTTGPLFVLATSNNGAAVGGGKVWTLFSRSSVWPSRRAPPRLQGLGRPSSVQLRFRIPPRRHPAHAWRVWKVAARCESGPQARTEIALLVGSVTRMCSVPGTCCWSDDPVPHRTVVTGEISRFRIRKRWRGVSNSPTIRSAVVVTLWHVSSPSPSTCHNQH